MSWLRKFFFGRAGVCGALTCLCFQIQAGEVPRSIPCTLPSHPGNIFLAGENVVVDAPPGPVDTWRVVDYANNTIASGPLKDGKAEVGPLPVGWYKIVRGKGYLTNRTFACVIEPLRAPTPATSPVCIDVAMAWFFPKEKMGEVVNVCQLAGINRVRDRLNWHQIELKRGEFVGPNQYDDSARIQHEGGLKILQVNHLSPDWAAPEPRRFPNDLRDACNFYREMAKRWRGQIEAFEPWNEADIRLFGGHTGSEMASMQKAAYLGLKAGNPDVIACQNVFAIRRKSTLEDFRNNEAWPYFDTYNLHHYEALSNYASLYADHRVGTAGKPMWTTECSVHVKWRGHENLKELVDEDLRLQSERVTKTYALAIHEGVEAVFYFMLPHYVERQLQYGLLRPDLTPRPGYVALAAVGRLLADAKPLGRLPSENDSLQGYVFHAQPDGKAAEVLVAWSETNTTYQLRKTPPACFDHLGRTIQITNNVLNLSRAPIYAILTDRPKLIPPAKPPKKLSDKPGNIVLQALLPETDVFLDKSAYKIESGQTKTVPLFLYNFGDKEARGRFKVTSSKGWKVELPNKAEINPGDRKELSLIVTPASEAPSDVTIRIAGDFGRAGDPVLSLRFTTARENPQPKP